MMKSECLDHSLHTRPLRSVGSMRSQHVLAAESSDGRVVSVMYNDGAFHAKPAMPGHAWAKEPMKAFLPEGYPHSVTADYASTHTDT